MAKTKEQLTHELRQQQLQMVGHWDRMRAALGDADIPLSVKLRRAGYSARQILPCVGNLYRIAGEIQQSSE